MSSDIAESLLMTDSLGLRDGTAGGAGASISHLIEQAQAGDADAFEQIMICYQHKVLATSWRMLGNEEDARDAGQEVFLRAYKYLKSFQLDRDFSGWLYRIIANVCHDIARKRGRRHQFTSIEEEREAGNLDTLAGPDDVEATAIRSQEQDLILRALATLSKKERAAIVLRDLEGLPTEEVARILGSSPTTVRSQISAGRAKIKQFRERVLNQARGGSGL